MADAQVQNVSSWNDSQVFLFFLCASDLVSVRIWIWCCCTCFILGIPASLVVLRELLGACNDFFMLNLHINDLIFASILLLAVCNVTVLKNLDVYHFVSFMHTLPMCGRPLLMACVCGDCYFAVVHPVTYKNRTKAGLIRKAVSFGVWIVVVCFGTLLGTVQTVYTSALISAPLAGALPVIMFCDVSILHALQKPHPSGSKTVHPQRRQALVTIFSSLTMTSVAYLPPAIIFFFAEVLPLSRKEIFCSLSFVGLCFYVVGCVTMPLLYLYSRGKTAYLKLWLREKYQEVKSFLFS